MQKLGTDPPLVSGKIPERQGPHLSHRVNALEHPETMRAIAVTPCGSLNEGKQPYRTVPPSYPRYQDSASKIWGIAWRQRRMRATSC